MRYSYARAAAWRYDGSTLAGKPRNSAPSPSVRIIRMTEGMAMLYLPKIYNQKKTEHSSCKSALIGGRIVVNNIPRPGYHNIEGIVEHSGQDSTKHATPVNWSQLGNLGKKCQNAWPEFQSYGAVLVDAGRLQHSSKKRRSSKITAQKYQEDKQLLIDNWHSIPNALAPKRWLKSSRERNQTLLSQDFRNTISCVEVLADVSLALHADLNQETAM